MEYRASACAYGVELPLMQQILAFDVALQLGHGDQVWLHINCAIWVKRVFCVHKETQWLFCGPEVRQSHLGRQSNPCPI